MRDEWGDKVKVVQPVLAEDRARQLGIDRPMWPQRLQSNFSGTTTGVYREGIELIPIIARAPLANAGPWRTWETCRSTAHRPGKKIPILQVVNGFDHPVGKCPASPAGTGVR